MKPTSDSSWQHYLDEIHGIARLTPEEEVQLARRIQAGDEEARLPLIRANLRLVVFLAKSFEWSGLSLEDLVAEGNVGLMQAASRFCPDRGARFGTYAAIWVRHAMRAAVGRQRGAVRVPESARAKLNQVKRSRARLTERLGRTPSNAEIAADAGVPVHEWSHLLGVSCRAISLEAEIHQDEGEGASYGELLPDDRAELPDDVCVSRDLRAGLRTCVATLDRREREVVESRFGLKGERPRTLEEVGRTLGVTRERVRQLQDRATRKLRYAFLKWEESLSTQPV